MVTISGAIVERRFVLMTLGQSIGVETLETGEDDGGPYAVVEEREYPLRDGRLVVEIEPDPFLADGAIGVQFDAPLNGFGVNFDGDGNVSGSSSAHPMPAGMTPDTLPAAN